MAGLAFRQHIVSDEEHQERIAVLILEARTIDGIGLIELPVVLVHVQVVGRSEAECPLCPHVQSLLHFVLDADTDRQVQRSLRAATSAGGQCQSDSCYGIGCDTAVALVGLAEAVPPEVKLKLGAQIHYVALEFEIDRHTSCWRFAFCIRGYETAIGVSIEMANGQISLQGHARVEYLTD